MRRVHRGALAPPAIGKHCDTAADRGQRGEAAGAVEAVTCPAVRAGAVPTAVRADYGC
jgi:hypothetical protein